MTEKIVSLTEKDEYNGRPPVILVCQLTGQL